VNSLESEKGVSDFRWIVRQGGSERFVNYDRVRDVLTFRAVVIHLAVSLAYQYTPYVWPMLASAAFMAALGVYIWRRRVVPGALPLAVAMLFGVLWAVGAALEVSAVDAATKIFWYKFQAICSLPASTAVFCFTLEYANPGRWLTRRTITLLAIPPILVALLILTNGAHHWLWPALSFQEYVQPAFGLGGWILLGYAYLLILLQTGVLLWLFVRSPLHRWPVALILVSRLATAAAYLLEVAGRNPFAPMDLTVLAMTVTSAMYALALFRFRLFELIPIAHETVIQQMREGMLILDAHLRVVDLNRSAEKILGVPAPRVRGRKATEVLPEGAGFSDQAGDLGTTLAAEISLGADDGIRYYALQLSPLKDRRSLDLGYLLLLHDVTEQRRARALLLEQQRVVATLEERQRLARELHDSVGQMLGYVSMQAQAIRKWVQDGDATIAAAQLTRLADVAQDAHDDIRESILCLKAGSAQEWSLVSALQCFLEAYRDRYGISTELIVPPDLEEQTFVPGAGVQLLRVIQEALTNARRHGRARCVQVAFERDDGWARIHVADDGCGFDPALISAGGDHLGLAFMRERMSQIGGGVSIHSCAGAGTQVEFRVPIRDEPNQGELLICPTSARVRL
jgi:PAS domain S-box-containing protein